MINLLPYLEDRDLMRQLEHKSDKYTLSAQYGLRLRLMDGIKLAKTFEYDVTTVVGILFGIAYSLPPYGEQGAAVLRELDPDYSRCRYAQILIRKLLSGIETDQTEIICRGIQWVMENPHGKVSGEVLIAHIVDYLYSQIDRLPTDGMRSVVGTEYIKTIIQRSEEEGNVVKLVFPDRYFEQFELRDAITYDPERAHKNMTTFYGYYLAHFDEIPDRFKMGFEAGNPELVTTCYLSTRGRFIIENTLEKLQEEGKL